MLLPKVTKQAIDQAIKNYQQRKGFFASMVNHTDPAIDKLIRFYSTLDSLKETDTLSSQKLCELLRIMASVVVDKQSPAYPAWDTLAKFFGDYYSLYIKLANDQLLNETIFSVSSSIDLDLLKKVCAEKVKAILVCMLLKGEMLTPRTLMM